MPPTCFVIQGFGKKPDFESGRTLDLDASYEVIKEAVLEAGLECARADEIFQSGHIEAVMYRRLFDADLVIADLSTSNVNAFYELGVRFALRPRATIVVAESKINFPFDINHIPIRTYEHLGPDIGNQEAKRFKAQLVALIKEIMAHEQYDSPVYTFLGRDISEHFQTLATLQPTAQESRAWNYPTLQVAMPDGQIRQHPMETPETVLGREVEPGVDISLDHVSVSARHAAIHIDNGRVMLQDLGSANGTYVRGRRLMPHERVVVEPRDDIQFGDCQATFIALDDAPTAVGATSPNPAEPSLSKLKREAGEAMDRDDFVLAESLWQKVRETGPKDDYVVQQLALATYKSESPTKVEALRRAKQILEYLLPRDSLDPETLGIWASVNKRLHELEGDPIALNEAISATERGFVLQRSYYNGINLAFMLDVRAASSADEASAEDRSNARSIRRRIIELCRDQLESSAQLAADERYWLLASIQEAYVGLGDEDSAAYWRSRAFTEEPAPWMVDTTDEQLARLRSMLATPASDSMRPPD